MVACRKKMTAGWVGTLAVYDGFHVRFGSMACSVVTSKTRWPAGSSQSATSAYQSLSRALRKRWAEFVFANEPSRPRDDFLAVVTPPNATPPQ